MAADLAFSLRTRIQSSFWFFVDDQPSIRALTQPLKPSPGLGLGKQIIALFDRLTSLSPTVSITLAWCPVHVGIPENEEAEQAAKAATTTGEPQHLHTSLAAVKQKINTACKTSVTKPPLPNVLRRLVGVHDPTQVRKGLSVLPRHSATTIAQLCAGHLPLSSFLHRIKATNDPNCQSCRQPETVEHYLMLCKNYVPQRKLLFEQLHRLHLHRRTQAILTNPRAFKPLVEYISSTERFAQARQWRPPFSQPN